ncbi:MAG: hypothetical protein CSA42_06910 [Gammaproteobacteria bacterium]|nr:MAG: hypothetical protein CSA42_06910 [Gammaproteobacteria bacterium]
MTLTPTSLVRIVLFILGIILTLDCLVLIFLLKINFGTVIPFIIGLLFLVHAFFWETIQNFVAKNQFIKKVWITLWGLFAIWFISFMLFIGFLISQINTQNNLKQVDALIVLGAGVNADKPTPTLASRLDKAAQLIQQQPNSLVIVSGGIGHGRKTSEAQVMANYLHHTYNIPLSKIKLEDKSTSTQTNLAFSKSILAKHNIELNQPIAIVTNDFHTIRAKAIAKQQGFSNVIMIASKTPLSIHANAYFREYFAFVSGYILNEYSFISLTNLEF